MSPPLKVSVDVKAALPPLMAALGYAQAEGFWHEVVARFTRWNIVREPRRMDWKPWRDSRTEWQ